MNNIKENEYTMIIKPSIIKILLWYITSIILSCAILYFCFTIIDKENIHKNIFTIISFGIITPTISYLYTLLLGGYKSVKLSKDSIITSKTFGGYYYPIEIRRDNIDIIKTNKITISNYLFLNRKIWSYQKEFIQIELCYYPINQLKELFNELQIFEYTKNDKININI
jgi:hypothetical protein